MAEVTKMASKTKKSKVSLLGLVIVAVLILLLPLIAWLAGRKITLKQHAAEVGVKTSCTSNGIKLDWPETGNFLISNCDVSVSGGVCASYEDVAAVTKGTDPYTITFNDKYFKPGHYYQWRVIPLTVSQQQRLADALRGGNPTLGPTPTGMREPPLFSQWQACGNYPGMEMPSSVVSGGNIYLEEGTLYVKYKYNPKNLGSGFYFGTSCWYRKAGEGEWVQFGIGPVLDVGSFVPDKVETDWALKVCQVKVLETDVAYEVAAGITVFRDLNGDKVYHAYDPHLTCGGKYSLGECTEQNQACCYLTVKPGTAQEPILVISPDPKPVRQPTELKCSGTCYSSKANCDKNCQKWFGIDCVKITQKGQYDCTWAPSYRCCH
jgi:hypothetical protein